MVSPAGLVGACSPALEGAQPAEAPHSWAFQPGADTYLRTALLDLRSLNEREAGAPGFLHHLTKHPDNRIGYVAAMHEVSAVPKYPPCVSHSCNWECISLM